MNGTVVQCWCIQAAAPAAPRASPPAAGWSVPGLAARGRGWGGGAAPPRLPPAPRPQAGTVLLPAVRMGGDTQCFSWGTFSD